MCHPGLDPGPNSPLAVSYTWVPAFAGMTLSGCCAGVHAIWESTPTARSVMRVLHQAGEAVFADAFDVGAVGWVFAGKDRGVALIGAKAVVAREEGALLFRLAIVELKQVEQFGH